MTGVTNKTGAAPRREGGPATIPDLPAGLAGGTSRLLRAASAERSRPNGVALCAEAVAPGLFAVAIVTEEGERLSLGPFEEEAVIAEWRRLGANSGLPLLIEHPDGRLEAPYPQIGPLQLGEIRIRRRHGLLNGRRPRFLVRRKTGRLPVRPAVYSEREIAVGRGA